MNAFKLFDKDAKGTMHKDMLRELLTAQGKPDERLTDQEVSCLKRVEKPSSQPTNQPTNQSTLSLPFFIP
jgi:Ca2+-binding EF-hand superfamily protein